MKYAAIQFLCGLVNVPLIFLNGHLGGWHWGIATFNAAIVVFCWALAVRTFRQWRRHDALLKQLGRRAPL